MRILTEAPTQGQFSAAWAHNNRSWSSTFRWESGVLFERNALDGRDETQWAVSVHGVPQSSLNPIFFTA